MLPRSCNCRERDRTDLEFDMDDRTCAYPAYRLCNSVRRDLSVAEARRIIRKGAELSLLW